MKLKNLSIITALIISAVFFITPRNAIAATHPNMYLNQTEINAIKIKIQKGEEPWKTAFNKLISEANNSLNKGPWSVTYGNSPGHDYFAERVYCGWKKVDGKNPDCRDGQINPNQDREDYTSANNLSKAIRNLGMAYAFTGQSRYADKVVKLIRTWTLDPTTYMTPSFPNGQSYITLSITLPGMFYAADLIWDYPGWSTSEKSAFQTWTSKMITSARGWSRSNNFENWRLVFISTASLITENKSAMNYAFNQYKAIIPNQISNKGEMKEELNRTKSLSYSLYALNAMIQTAEIAKHQGINLYDYQDTTGKGLKLALDYYAPYALSPNQWTRQQIAPIKKNDNMAMWELAYSHWQEPAYLKIINRWGRPLEEIRIMGWTTLTHANRFESPQIPRFQLSATTLCGTYISPPLGGGNAACLSSGGLVDPFFRCENPNEARCCQKITDVPGPGTEQCRSSEPSEYNCTSPTQINFELTATLNDCTTDTATLKITSAFPESNTETVNIYFKPINGLIEKAGTINPSINKTLSVKPSGSWYNQLYAIYLKDDSGEQCSPYTNFTPTSCSEPPTENCLNEGLPCPGTNNENCCTEQNLTCEYSPPELRNICQKNTPPPTTTTYNPCEGVLNQNNCKKCIVSPPIDDKYGYEGAWTAFGCFPTDPSGFATKVIQILFGLAGGVAFLLIIYGAFLCIVSNGDPQKVQACKETITSAIVGLIMLIFSLMILAIIFGPVGIIKNIVPVELF